MLQARLVLDTNTLFRALASPISASGKVLHLCETRIIIPLLSKAVMDEYRAVLTDPQIVAGHPRITPKSVTDALDHLLYVGEYLRSVRTSFSFPRDPMYVALAIQARATHLITHDKDLLSLPTESGDAGKRFRQRLPGVKVMQAATFVREHPHLVAPPEG